MIPVVANPPTCSAPWADLECAPMPPPVATAPSPSSSTDWASWEATSPQHRLSCGSAPDTEVARLRRMASEAAPDKIPVRQVIEASPCDKGSFRFAHGRSRACDGRPGTTGQTDPQRYYSATVRITVRSTVERKKCRSNCRAKTGSSLARAKLYQNTSCGPKLAGAGTRGACAAVAWQVAGGRCGPRLSRLIAAQLTYRANTLPKRRNLNQAHSRRC